MFRRLHALLLLLLLSGSFLGAKIAIYGDTRTHHDVHARIVAAIAAHQPSLAFHTGDLVQRGTTEAEYDRWFEISSPLLQLCPIWPAKGNHERDRDRFISRFQFPGGSSYYVVEHDSIRWIVLDSTLDLRPGSEQYTWLSQQLNLAALPIVIFLHHPIFSSGEHGSELGLELFLPALFESAGVLAVISGHEHQYEHLIHNGSHYIISGGGGAPIRELGDRSPYSLVLHKKHHYIIAERSSGALQMKVYDLDGALLDSFSISLAH